MKTELLFARNPESIRRAVAILRAGGLLAFPTDTVYGVGASALDPAAVLHIYDVKERPPEKAIPILVASREDVLKVVTNLDPTSQKLADRFWPGPLTLILPRAPAISDVVSAGPTVGVRIPDHTVCRELLSGSGPLAVSSANLSGHPSATTAHAVLEQLGGRVDAVLDGGRTPGGLASTVVECRAEDLVVLRPGPLSLEQLRRALK